MMYLYYQNKFYKTIDDTLAKEISLALVSPKRPYHIMVDGEALKSSQLEVRANTEAVPRKFPYDYRNEAHKKVIRQFAAEMRMWFAMQPKERQCFEYYLAEKGAIRLEGEPRIGGFSGLPLFGPNQIIVRNPTLMAELSEKWSAYQDFMRFASKMKAQDEATATALAKEADQMFNPV